MEVDREVGRKTRREAGKQEGRQEHRRKDIWEGEQEGSQEERKGGREEGWEVRKVVLESIDKDKEAMVGPAGHVFQNMLSSDHYDSWTQALR